MIYVLFKLWKHVTYLKFSCCLFDYEISLHILFWNFIIHVILYIKCCMKIRLAYRNEFLMHKWIVKHMAWLHKNSFIYYEAIYDIYELRNILLEIYKLSLYESFGRKFLFYDFGKLWKILFKFLFLEFENVI
jgi:hypothetical protein